MRLLAALMLGLLVVIPCALAQDAPPDADLGLPAVDADALMADVTRLAGELKADAERLLATEGKDAAIARLRAEAAAGDAVAFERLNLACVLAVLAGDAEGAAGILTDEIPACTDEELTLALARHAVVVEAGAPVQAARNASGADLAWQGGMGTGLDATLARLALVLAGLARVAPDSLDIAKSHDTVGIVRAKTGDPGQALACFERSLAIRERLAPGSLDSARSYHNIATVYIDRGDLDRALDYLARSLQIKELLCPGSLACASSYTEIGVVYGTRGDPDRALEYFEMGLAIHERLASRTLDCATSYANMGIVYSDRGDLDRALGYYGKGLAIQELLAPDSLGCARSYANVATVCRHRGDLDRALESFERSLAIQERLAPESLGCASTYLGIGDVCRDRGYLDRALEYYRRGLAIQERAAPGSLACAGSYLSIGIVYRSRGDLDRALEYYEMGLAIKERVAPDSLRCASALLSIGNIHDDRGDLGRALEYYERALAIRQRLAPDSLGCAANYGNIGAVYARHRAFDRALEYLRKDLAITERQAPGSLDCAASYGNIADAYSDRGDFDRALEYDSKAAAICRAAAPQSADHAIFCARAARAAAALTQTAEARALFEEAVTALESARARSAGANEEAARRGFSGQYEWIYRDYIRFLLDQGDAEGAAGISERMRAQGLREALFARVISAAGAAGAGVATEWERIGGMREALPARLEAARARKDDALVAEIEAERGQLDQDETALRDRARAEAPRLAAILFPEKLGIEALQALLGPEDVALSYVLGKDEVSVLVLTSAGPVEAVKLPVTADEVRAALFAADAPEGADYRWITRIAVPPGEEGGDDRGIPLEARGIPIEARGEGDGARGGSGLYLQPEVMAEACATLWERLLAPVAGKLGDKQRVLVLPDGVLYTVPWAALTDGDGKTLLERAAVVVLPSLQTLGLLRTEAGARAAVRTDRQELCAVGGAEYPDAPGEYGGLRDAVADYSPRETILAKVRAKEPVGLGPLPFAGMEVLAVGQTLGAYPGILAGPDATEPLARERAPHSRYVHFACHGYFDYRNPLDSGLILGLTQANPDDPTADGFLTAEDILGLALSGKGLDADLVTLSACRTAVGKDSGGEGMIGLTRALMFAGTPTVVSTLWSVADESTKELMTRFYANVRAGLDKAAALRQAQLSLRSDSRWSSPYYWAPFVLWGDWN